MIGSKVCYGEPRRYSSCGISHTEDSCIYITRTQTLGRQIQRGRKILNLKNNILLYVCLCVWEFTFFPNHIILIPTDSPIHRWGPPFRWKNKRGEKWNRVIFHYFLFPILTFLFSYSLSFLE